MHETSRTAEAAGLRWHVQVVEVAPQRPWVLLLHGTGASTHSWRGLAPLLAPQLNLIAPDLPGHGFTPALPGAGMSLPGMAAAIAALLKAMQRQPALIVGHSAGAAIAIRLALDGLPVRGIVGLNAALLPLGGFAGRVFSPAARLLARSRWVPRLFARRAADPAVVKRLIASTGSRLDDEGVALYGRLVADPAHAAVALAMMANWDLERFAADLPRLGVPLTLIVGSNDRTLPPQQSRDVQAMLPGATFTSLPGLGHLAHEERPDLVAPLILDAARAACG